MESPGDPADRQSVPRAQERTFVQLHRDVWRVVRAAPWIFLVLPAVVWFPVDYGLEIVLDRMNVGLWEELRISFKVDSLTTWILGTFISSIQLATIGLLARGERVEGTEALRRGFGEWSRLMGVFFAAAWRVGFATLLLVIPGIYLMVRYALAMPAAMFDQKRGAAALEKSAEYVKGRGWKIFFIGVGAAFLYLPVLFSAFLVVPEDDPFLFSLASVPANVVFPLIGVAMALVYADRRQDWQAREPVGQPTGPAAVGEVGLRRPGRAAVWVVGLGGYAVFIALFVGVMAVTELRVAAADADFEAGRYEDSLAKFERLNESVPDDPYILYSIAWNHVMLDDLERGESYMARAVALASEDPFMAFDYATLLMDLGRLGEAEGWIDQAEALGHPNVEAIDELRSLATGQRVELGTLQGAPSE